MKGEGFIVHNALTAMMDSLDGEARAAVLGAAYAIARGTDDYELPKRYAYLQFVVEGMAHESAKLNASIVTKKEKSTERVKKFRQKAMEKRRKEEKGAPETPDETPETPDETHETSDETHETSETSVTSETNETHETQKGRNETHETHETFVTPKERNKERNKYIPQTPKGVLMDMDDEDADYAEAQPWGEPPEGCGGDGADGGEDEEVETLAAAIVRRHGNKAGADGFRRSLRRYLAKNPDVEAEEVDAAHRRWCASGAWNPGYEPKLKNWLWGGEWRHEPPERKKGGADKAAECEFGVDASL